MFLGKSPVPGSSFTRKWCLYLPPIPPSNTMVAATRIQAYTISQGDRRVSPLHRRGPRFLVSARLPRPIRVCHSPRSILLAKFPLSCISIPITNVHGPLTMVETLAPLAFIHLRSRGNVLRNACTTTRQELALASKRPRGANRDRHLTVPSWYTICPCP